MKVQELIDQLADFRHDANVTFWIHNEKANAEVNSVVMTVARDRNGNVGLNWSEDARPQTLGSFKIHDSNAGD